MLTLKRVNKALAEAGYAERLVKGCGYYYFAEGEAASWPSTMVLVYKLNCQTLEEWMRHHQRLRREARQHHGVAGYDEVGLCGS